MHILLNVYNANTRMHFCGQTRNISVAVALQWQCTARRQDGIMKFKQSEKKLKHDIHNMPHQIQMGKFHVDPVLGMVSAQVYHLHIW